MELKLRADGALIAIYAGERWGSAHAIRTSIEGVEGAHLFDALLQDFSIDKHKVYLRLLQCTEFILLI